VLCVASVCPHKRKPQYQTRCVSSRQALHCSMTTATHKNRSTFSGDDTKYKNNKLGKTHLKTPLFPFYLSKYSLSRQLDGLCFGTLADVAFKWRDPLQMKSRYNSVGKLPTLRAIQQTIRGLISCRGNIFLPVQCDHTALRSTQPHPLWTRGYLWASIWQSRQQ
jgi:hypothetical protein